MRRLTIEKSNLFRRLLLPTLLCWSLTLPVVMAQPFSSSNRDRSKLPGETERNRCTELSVEPQITLSRKEGGAERSERTVDFTITVFVTNQCQEPVQLQHSSFVSYRTNFPPLVQEINQSPECLAQQRSLSGLVPPLQKVPFAFRVQGCTFPATQMESPQVTLETGRVIINGAEKPIPSITEMLP